MPTLWHMYARALGPCMPSVTMGIRPYAHCHKETIGSWELGMFVVLMVLGRTLADKRNPAWAAGGRVHLHARSAGRAHARRHAVALARARAQSGRITGSLFCVTAAWVCGAVGGGGRDVDRVLTERG